MDFCVNFFTSKPVKEGYPMTNYVIYTETENVGMSHLRQVFGLVEAVKLEDVRHYIQGRQEASILVTVPVKLAIELNKSKGYFENEYKAKVEVTPASLNRFLELKGNASDSGSIVIHSMINEIALIAAWVSAGAPLEWDPQGTNCQATEVEYEE